MLIELLFDPWLKSKVLEGIKYCTSRNKAHGVPGDTFCVGHKMYCLIKVEAKRLADVAGNCFHAEGCDTPEDFIQEYNRVYRHSARFNPEKIVIVHWFAEVGTK
ncbi:MAG: hypothetical protein A4E28_00019 [Methanocella sp. PtaU1.Bin125]|nr:MAG: hypothetical protein A4E28_00019 [Methanocella sp. PtaU1.Bin125]